jgi:hypothetical protein
VAYRTAWCAASRFYFNDKKTLITGEMTMHINRISTATFVLALLLVQGLYMAAARTLEAANHDIVVSRDDKDRDTTPAEQCDVPELLGPQNAPLRSLCELFWQAEPDITGLDPDDPATFPPPPAGSLLEIFMTQVEERDLDIPMPGISPSYQLECPLLQEDWVIDALASWPWVSADHNWMNSDGDAENYNNNMPSDYDIMAKDWLGNSMVIRFIHVLPSAEWTFTDHEGKSRRVAGLELEEELMPRQLEQCFDEFRALLLESCRPPYCRPRPGGGGGFMLNGADLQGIIVNGIIVNGNTADTLPCPACGGGGTFNGTAVHGNTADAQPVTAPTFPGKSQFQQKKQLPVRLVKLPN